MTQARSIWTSGLAGDERNGTYENIYQGEVILAYHLTDSIQGFCGVQRSSRKESFDLPLHTILNRLVSLVCLVALVCLVHLVSLSNQKNQTDETDQTDQKTRQTGLFVGQRR